MKFKLICFDLDGTIIDETTFIWQTIHEHLKTDSEKRKKATEEFYDKKISYEEWAKHDVELWKEKGATKKEILSALEPLKLMKGAKETIVELKKKGFIFQLRMNTWLLVKKLPPCRSALNCRRSSFWT